MIPNTFKKYLAIALVALCGLLFLQLTGCASASTAEPFVLGDETVPPRGCIEARTRGVDC